MKKSIETAHKSFPQSYQDQSVEDDLHNQNYYPNFVEESAS